MFLLLIIMVVCDTAKVRFFKQITTNWPACLLAGGLFAILQKYDFSSKSQLCVSIVLFLPCCLRYCKSTIFQANHNPMRASPFGSSVVCDTAKVRFFKQITTTASSTNLGNSLFAILQKYDFSSKSQRIIREPYSPISCLRYCKSTIFQANHNRCCVRWTCATVVCDTAKVRFFKQITTIAQSYHTLNSCLRYCKSTIFQANHNRGQNRPYRGWLFAILQKYDFSSKSQRHCQKVCQWLVVCDTAKVRFFKQITTKLTLFLRRTSCLRYCKSTIFQANHNFA